MSSALKQAEHIVDILKPEERVLLLQYIAPKLGESSKVIEQTEDANRAWQAFRKIGRRISAMPTHGVSATDAVSEMRR